MDSPVVAVKVPAYRSGGGAKGCGKWFRLTKRDDREGRDRVTELSCRRMLHDIPKKLVWSAWLKVKENGGAAGVDGVTIEQFEERLKDNLYRLWNRMSSGSYFPGPVRAVEIPKKGGTRVLGIPNVVDRVAQTAAVLALEPEVGEGLPRRLLRISSRTVTL